MKAIVYTQYGPPDVLQLREVAKPEPREGQVLVRVHAASANALDYRRFEEISPLGRISEERVLKTVNKVLGADIAGRVETVGAAVTQFRPGDEVFGVSAGSAGGFAEYACAVEDHLALKPEARLLPTLIGWGKTRELLYRGHLIDSFEAQRIGFVQRLAHDHKIDAELQRWIDDILRAEPNAIRAQKRLIESWLETSPATGIQASIDAFSATFHSDIPNQGCAHFSIDTRDK